MAFLAPHGVELRNGGSQEIYRQRHETFRCHPLLGGRFSFALMGRVLHIRRCFLLIPARVNFLLIISRVLRSRLADGVSKVCRSK
jgi:hypothetical protein